VASEPYVTTLVQGPEALCAQYVGWTIRALRENRLRRAEVLIGQACEYAERIEAREVGLRACALIEALSTVGRSRVERWSL